MTGEREPLAAVLDRYRSIEGWNADDIEAWVAVTRDEALRGGLRTILRREQAHAAELEARLRELGADPTAEVPAAQREQTRAFYGAPTVPDLAKLGALVDVFRDPETLLGFVVDVIRDPRTDGQTRELLRTILDDEKATIDWVRAAHADRALRATGASGAADEAKGPSGD